MKGKLALAVGLLLLLGGAAAWVLLREAPSPAGPEGVAEFTAEEVERILQHSPLGAPPPDPTNAVADRPEAALLGQAVFFDKRFSGSGKVSCSVCHDPARGLGDGKAITELFPVERNIPTLWNAAYGRWFFWDGRADSLWSQALQPLENPREHAFTRLQVVHLIRTDARLKAAYETVFGRMPDLADAGRFPAAGGPVVEGAAAPLRKAWDSMTEADRALVDGIFSNVGKAMEAYERKLISRKSRFDAFVEGLRTGDRAKMEALSAPARLGLKLFVGKGNCRLCHSGPTFTDGEFHNLGIPPLRGGPSPFRFAAVPQLQRDPFNGKGAYSDDRAAGAAKLDFLVNLPDSWGQVKTPGLRNVAKTGPYMHQGQFKTLQEVILFYSILKEVMQAGHHERTILLPLLLEKSEVEALVAFLESLTDETVDGSLLKPLP